MHRDSKQQRVTLAVGIALSAGVFSIMPSASAAPVLDHVVDGGAVIDQKTVSNITDITSTTRNNVIDWQDFSAAQGETVRFDGGEKTNNYLNVVSGANISHIDGAIKGGNNVYIVNPNGVVFGNSASVDVGNLYVSSRPLDTVNYEKTDANGDMQPLADTAAMSGGDIVNMGTVQANAVFLEGGNIVIGEVNRIRTADGSEVNNNVTIQTNGNITLGKSVSSIVAEKNAKANAQNNSQVIEDKAVATTKAVTDNAAPTGGYTYTLKSAANVLPLIYDEEDLMKVSADCVGKTADYTYTLKNDLNFSKSSVTFKPIANFGSTFDGEFHSINVGTYTGAKNVNVGLFANTNGATIKNVGVSGGTITAQGTGYAGGIVGSATNTALINVFNEGTTIKGAASNSHLGGIVGNMNVGSITTAYNTGTVGGSSGSYTGGIAGQVQNKVEINHVYNTGTTPNGIVGAKTGSSASITDAYSTKGGIHGSYANNITETQVITITDTTKKSVADYTGKLSSISNEGGKDATGKYPTWRIYEGQSLPLLRAFLTARGTVTVNYDYKQGDAVTGSNGGKDLTVTYNSKDIALENVSYTKDGAAFTPGSDIITAPTNNIIDGDITAKNYNTTTKTVRTLAAFYTGQQGYDLVGNNYTIKQRVVDIAQSAVGTEAYSREYNGTNDASGALEKFSYGGANGIVPEDLTNGKVSIDTSNVSAYFVGTNGKPTDADAPDVGANKTIAVIGSVTLDNGSGYYNYKLSENSAVIGTAANPLTFDGNSITQKAVMIGLNVAEGINKEYDGETTVADTFKPSAQIAQTVNGITTGSGDNAVTQTLTLTYADEAHYVDGNDSPTKKAGTYTDKVKYSGIKIKGVSSGSTKNYKLVNAAGDTIYSEAVAGLADTGIKESAGGSLYGSGAISKKNLVSTGFSWYDGDTAKEASREYSGYSAYEKPVGKEVKNTEAGMLENDDLTFSVQSANFVTSETGSLNANNQRTASPTKNAGAAKGVLYTVKITGGDAVNYTLDGVDIDDNTKTVIGPGSITPRTLNLIVNANADTDKVYDGNEYVTGATENEPAYLTDAILNGTTGFLRYKDTGDTDHHFLSTIDPNAKIKVIGKYQITGNDYGEAKNVNYDAVNNAALVKDIVYEAAVMEGEAESSNYKFAIINKNNGESVVTAKNTEATQAEFSGTDAQGIINPREIDKIVFADVEKTYDGDSVVTNTTNNGDGVTFKTNDRIAITDLQQGADSALAATGEALTAVLNVDENGQISEGTAGALISGVYGEGSTDWQANEHAGTKTVHYTVSDGIWKNHNYKLAPEAKFEGAGTINPLAIAPDDIKLERNSTAITKVYNGDDNVATVADNVGNVKRSVEDYLTERQAYVSKDGKELDIAVSVDGANYETLHHQNKSGSTNLKVDYKVSLVNATDYTITDTNGNSVTQITRDVDADGNPITGIINARPITVTTENIVNNDVSSGGLTKVYDATPNAVGSGESLVSGINSQILSDDQTKGVVNTTTGVYNNKHVNSNDTANLDENGLKPVTYDLQLANNDYGDYKFVNANGNDISQIVGKGTIEKRSLTLTTKAYPVKTYSDGSAAVETADMPTAAKIDFGSTENNDVVALDGFTSSALTGEYQITGTEENAGDVNRAADHSVLDKNIIYSGVLTALGTENVGNYDVADTFPGTGLIDPNTINYLDFKFNIKNKIKQTYSGSDTVGEYGMEGEALTNFQKGWIDKEKSGIQVGNKLITLTEGAYGISSVEYAKFNDANADTEKTVKYKIHVDPDTLQNYDYEETYTDNTGTHTVAKDSIYLEAVNNTGIIEKRAVVVSVTHDTLEKYYDGTTDIYNGDNAHYSGDTAGGIILSGENAVTFADAVHTVNYKSDGTLETVQTGLIDGANESTGDYVGAGMGIGTKTINYTAKVDDAHSGNYKFVDAGNNELLNGQGGILTTYANTINPFGVVVTVNDTNKTYDGGLALDSDAAAAKTKAVNALQLGVNYDNGLALSNITSKTGAYDDPNVNNGAAHTVTYTGFTLNNDNYYLAKANGEHIDTDSEGNNVIKGKGYISKYTLTDVPNFIIHDVTKEYDTDTIVKYNTSEDKNLIKEHFVTAENLPGSLAYDLVSANYTDGNRGDKNKHVDFVIKISGDNYDFSTLINKGSVTAGTDSIQKTYTADDATITPRKVYVSLADTPEITKTYDGNTGVKQDVTDKIIVRAGDLLNDDTTLNNSASAINARYDNEDAGNRTVTYDVKLQGDAAGNYEIHRLSNLGTSADGEYSTLEGTGVINKAKLTIDPASMSKTYNGKVAIGDGTNAGDDAWTKDKLVFKGVNNETFTLTDEAFGKVSGQYGFGKGDANVSWNGNEVAYKDVQYTGLGDALAVMNADSGSNAISKNYTIDDTVKFTAAEAKGKIKPVTINQTVNENWKPVIREYNADTDLNEVYDYTGGVKGKQLGIKDILKLTADDIAGKALNIDYEAAGEYDNKDAGNDHVLKYQINSVTKKVKDGSGNANYVLDDSMLNTLAGSTLDSAAEQVKSVITPRQLNASVVKADGNRKIYDGTKSSDKTNYVLDAEDQAILAKDNLLNNIVVTAEYDTKNASVAPNGADTNSKTITYTLKLNGDNKNYSIATPTATALGDVEQRKVYVEPINVNGINKEYNGTKALPTGFNAEGRFQLSATDDNTGIVADEEDIQLNFGAIQGVYSDRHAGDRTIAFSNFALEDTNTLNDDSLSNYTLETNSLTGSGTISPKALVVGIKAAPVKEYNTTSAISAAYANANNLYLQGETAGDTGVLDGDSVNLQVNSAEYVDANAAPNKKYSYGLSIDNADYKLVQGNNMPTITVGTDGQSGVVTAYDGVINKRKVYVSLADTPEITKTYDGNTGVKQDVTDKIIVRAGDLLNDGTTLNNSASAINARYDNKDAGNRTVTYDVKLQGGAAGNYEIHRLSNLGTSADGEYSTLEGTGVINKAKLTIDPAAMSKTYNGEVAIGDGTNAGDDAWTKDKLVFKGVNNETFTLTDEAFGKVSGQYGFGKGDANVSWNGNEVAYKDVQYTGLGDALAVMNADSGSNAISKNYTIDDTVKFSAAEAKGKIKPVTINQTVNENWKPVIREYNADTDLNEVYDYTGGVKGKQLGIKDILKLTADDIAGNALNIDYEAAGEYDNKDAGNDHVLKYQINSVTKKVKDGSGNANYVLDDSMLNTLEGSTLDSAAEQVYSVITPRQLNASVVKADGNRKIYDGTTASDKTNYVLDAEDQAILAKDNLLNNIVVTAEYDTKNASVAPDGADTNSKTITYTLKLNGDNKNYSIATPTATALGDIEQRKVYVEPINVNGINKEYDGTKALPAGFNAEGRFQLSATDDNTGIVAGEEDIQLNFGAIQGVYSDKHAGDRTIAFSNFALEDTNTLNDNSLSNYTLETDSLTGSGTISPKALVVGIKAAPVKEYDTTSAISAAYANANNLYLQGETAGDAGVLDGDSVNLQVNSAEYVDANAAPNKKYSYGLSIDNADYKLVQGNNMPTITVGTDGQSGVVTAYDGVINKRKVYVSLADTPEIVKTYDGNAKVKQDVTNKIIVRAGDLLNDGTTLNNSASAINARYDNKDAGNRTVTYDVKLQGDAAGNYEIHRLANLGTSTDGTYSTLEGTGVINKAKLTIDPAAMTKTYNGEVAIGDGTNAGDDAWTKDKLVFKGVNNETFTLTDEAFGKVSGQYGFGSGDANVSWNGDEVAYKDVQYKGLSNALAVMNADDSSNAISKNYTIDDTVKFTAAEAKGKIKPVTINQTVNENWKPVIREYNADTDLNEVYDYTGGVKGKQLGIKDILKLTADDIAGNALNIDYEAAGEYDNKNAGNDHVLKYQINSVTKKVKDGSGNANYVLADSMLNTLAGSTLDSEAEQVKSVITPRQLNAEVIKAEDVRKIYDGTTAGDPSNFVLEAEDQAILAKDNLLNNIAITARYNNKNASVAPNGADTNSKTIIYTLALNGDNNNYSITTPTAEASGDIEQRRVYVEPVNINGIDKVYDGTKDLPTGFSNAEHFRLAAKDADTGIVAGDEDIQLNTGVIQGGYENKHAGNKTINFTNFALEDTDAVNGGRLTNYTLETDSLTGSGTISPKALVVGIKAAPVKEYDTTSAISADYANANNLYLQGETAGDTGVLDGDSVNLQVNSAEYVDANAAPNKKYSYGLSIDNADYKLVQGNNMPTITVGTDGQSGVVTAYDGVINKRKVYVSLADTPEIVKTYDGNTGVKQDVTDKIIVRAGDLLNDGTTLNNSASAINARYDNEDAGNRTVTYDVKLQGGAAGNYEIHRLSNLGTSADGEYSTLEGTGVINKAKLTIDPAAMSKTYNGEVAIGDGTNAGDDAWTKDKLVFKGVNNETFTLTDEAFGKVSGQYGFGSGDANVSWNGDEVAYKDVQYTGLGEALAVMNADSGSNAISKNYTIDDTVKFSAAEAKGKIKPVTINQTVNENWKPVIREYNADTDLNEVYDYTGGVKGKQLGIKDILKLTADDIAGNALNIDYEAAGEYDNKDAGNDHVLKYQINSVTKKVKDGSGNANYVLDDSMLNTLAGSTLDSAAEQVYSVITPRQLNASVVKADGNRKIYDGTTASDKTNYVLDAEDQAILAKDNLLNNIVVTAEYDTKNASVAPNGADTNSKTITYTLKLNGDNKNYSIATPTATALGDIEQRKVYVEPINVNGINKEYDGTKALPAGFNAEGRFQLSATDDNTGIVAGEEDIQLNFGAIQGEYSDKHAGDRTIAFSNFALEDTNTLNDNSLTNYTLETNSLTGSGTISPKALVVGIKAAPVKEYDTTSAISAAYANANNLYLQGEKAGDTGVLDGDSVNLQVNSAEYVDANAAPNKKYSYGLSIDNADYKLVQGNNMPTITVGTDGQSGVVTAYDGVINKRKVYVSLADTPEIVKTYDGNAKVKQDVTDKIIVRAGDLLNDGTTLNNSASAINARYDNKDAGNRTVTYDVKLQGDAAGNYEIHRLANLGTSTDGAYSTLEGTGVINKAKLTIDPASMSKTYNGTAAIGDGTNAGDDAWTKDKLVFKGVNNETFTLTDEAFGKVIGQYGFGSGDANVSWNGDEVAYKDVQYTGLSNALAVMNADDNNNAISKNYTIDDTAYFNAADAKGKIKPVVITKAAAENWKPVIREYNADTDLQTVYDYSGGVAGKQLGINDILTLTVTDINGNELTIDYEAAGNYDDKNVGGSHALNYHINSVNKKVSDGKGKDNYVLDTSVLNALKDKNLDSTAEQVYSVITPRQLNAEVAKAFGNRKVYDGTSNADTGNFVLDKEDQAVLAKDNLLNNIVVTAYYDDQNASIAPNGSASDSKTITYTLGLNDNSGNYQIATPAAKALGDIEQRRVYVEAVDIDNIDKVYDGTTAMPDGYTSGGRFALVAADGSTGIVTGDEDIMLNTRDITGQYASAHVQRDADGLPTAQTIRFTNFTLQDANAGNDNNISNYYVVTDSLQGSGTITPRSLTVGIKDAPVKVYDGETALSSTYAANDNLVIEGLLPEDNANVLIDSAAYADVNAGKNKEYSYNFRMGNGDYELVQGAGKPTLTVTDNGQSGTITAHDGTITPRILTASVIKDMTKEFDGTTDGAAFENAGEYILLSDNYLGKDKDSLGLTAAAVFDNANAGKSEDSDELENHKVTYTLNLANPNYELAESTVTGEGTIYRKGLTIVAQPAAVYAGEQMPKFSGTVEGLLENDNRLGNLFTFAPLSTTTTNRPGSYPVYGWYNNRFSGNLGRNYSFSQAVNNENAFTVNYLGDNNGIPDIQFTPTRDVYQQISRDRGSGFGDNGMAAIEYVNKDGQVIGRETVDSGEINGSRNAAIAITGVDPDSTSLANIGISGGDVVNMEGANAAGQANIEVDGDGSIVNLQVVPLDGAQSADGRNSAAEIVATDENGSVRNNSSASIQIVDESGNVLEEEHEDKAEKQEKEGEIAIESEDGQNEDEIELKVEGEGVNVA